MQAEEAKKPMPGAGLCPGYTISRAILADAVCLTRGDRFLTVDFTRSLAPSFFTESFAKPIFLLAFNFTSWGYQDCQFDKNDGSYGGMVTKLLFRTLPNHYPAGSAYAHFPFMVPSFMEKHLGLLPDKPNVKYTWSRPPIPTERCVVTSYEDVKKVLEDNDFESNYGQHMHTITKGAVLYKRVVNFIAIDTHYPIL